MATGCLEGNTLTCHWHGFQYDLTTGQLLVDPNASLEMYPVWVPAKPALKPELKANEFLLAGIAPGQIGSVQVDICPWHDSRFDVRRAGAGRTGRPAAADLPGHPGWGDRPRGEIGVNPADSSE